MTDYITRVEKIFMDHHKDGELQVNEENFHLLEETLRLLELDDDKQANLEIENSPKLKQLFGLEDLRVFNEEDSVNESETEEIINSDVETIPETFRMDNMKPEKGESSYMGSKRRRTNQARYFPDSTKSKVASSKGSDDTFLNIDCQYERKEIIDKWAAELSLIIQTNPEAYQDPRTILLLIEHKSLGVAKEFIKNTNWKNAYHEIPENILEGIIDALYTMFLGIDFSGDKAREKLLRQEKAKKRLTDLQLCDICYLEDFTCDYELNLYKLEQSDFPELILQYLRKIPLVGSKALKKFITETEGSRTISYSLGYAHKIVKDELFKHCESIRTQKKLKKFNKKCCIISGEKPVEYGCKIEYRKKKKPFFKKYSNKYKFVKKKKKFQSGKFFKKSDKKSEKQKFCPKGKKNCRCWICNIEGHYANECPNRQDSNKIKILELAYKMGFEPIEEKYDEKEYVYIIKIEKPGRDPSSSENSSSNEELEFTSSESENSE